VIGINTAVSSEGQNVGFALPINVVKDAIAVFDKTGAFNRPYLGVSYKVVTHDVSALNGLPEGAYLTYVAPKSPAGKAGLVSGDIVTKIDDTPLLGDTSELSKVVGTKRAGDTLTVEIWRNGKPKTVTVTLGTQN
jgi:serine protease Do